MKRSELASHLHPVLLRRRAHLLCSLDSELLLLSQDHEELCEDEIFAHLSHCESRELRDIDEALWRIRMGSYGACEECGRNIPLARLKAIPFAATCIECQRLSETDEFAAAAFCAS